MSAIAKVGVYVDVENIRRNGGFGMQYDILRKFACRDSAQPVRLNAYVGFDKRRAKNDSIYETKIRNFFFTLREYGFKVIEKEVKWFRDEEGLEFAKANADLDMAVDALLQSENLDRVLLVTGDGDFVQVVRALQNKGCRVEAVAFDHVSWELRREADMFMSGYLIPNLLPVSQPQEPKAWGKAGSRVRGICYYYRQNESYGFMRFIRQLGDLWITDTRDEDSPYETVYFHDSQFAGDIDLGGLPSRNKIFEFRIARSKREKGKLQAEDIMQVSVG
ncbi:MAG: NYN domain-containing protein [Nitrospiraceae bacterium]|nr:MAG: NYN domain-containing protein [Nitrospiraceae bacterium]